MSAFERRVRFRKSSAGTEADVQFEATAQAIAAGATEDELIDRAAYAFRAWEIKQQTAREIATDEAVDRQAQVLAFARSRGLEDAQGRVKRSDVKRKLKSEQARLAGVPAAPPEPPSEPRRAPSGIRVPEPGEMAALTRELDP